MSALSPAAIREIFNLQKEADRVLAQSTVTRSEAKKADLLISRISSIRATGLSSDELTQTLVNEIGKEIAVPEERQFKQFLAGAPDSELRDTTLVAGMQTIGYTQGPTGGYLVPAKFNQSVVEGMALTDPLLDESIVTVIRESNYSLRPISLPGWDLSTTTAVKVAEIAQHGADAIPTLTTQLLNKFGYRVAFDASREWDEDAKGYGDPMAALGRAIGIAFARGIGQDLVNGDGAVGPQGVVTGSADSGVTTANAGKVVLGDFTNVFFSVNKIYRDSPKAAWLVNDAVAKMIANAVDDSHRPLFPVVNGVTQILGKPVYVCPSLPAYNASLGTQHPGSFAVFGDLSHYIVHASAVLMRRLLQVPGLVEYGKIRFHGLQLIDAAVVDPTDGALPAIVSARLHS